MTDLNKHVSFARRSLRWDAHACLPLHPQASLEPLLRFAQAGVHYLSINVGMDLNPLEQVMRTLACFRQRILATPELTLVTDLDGLRVERARAQPRLTIGFDLEGALPLLGTPEMVALYHALGVRQIHLAYNRNNHAAGGCHDLEIPLSPLGKRYVEAINRAGILMDGSHNGERSILDLTEYSQAPVIVSHANPRTLVDHERNISDQVIKAIAHTQGVICLNGVSWFLGEECPTVDRLIDHIVYVSDLVGIEHVGLGLDSCFTEPHLNDDPPAPYEPNHWWPASAGYDSGLAKAMFLQPEDWSLLPEALSLRGFSQTEIYLILGENMARVMSEVERVSRDLKQDE